MILMTDFHVTAATGPQCTQQTLPNITKHNNRQIRLSPYGYSYKASCARPC